MSNQKREYNWKDVLGRLRKEVRKDPDRIEWDLENDIVRGVQTTGTQHAQEDGT